jgi:hypothetical protein
MVYGFAAARPAAAAQEVTVSLGQISPAVATSPSTPLSLSGRLTVPSGQSHQDVIVQLGYTAIQDRSDMNETPEDSPEENQLDNVQDYLGEVSAGTHSWSLRTTVGALDPMPDTVYALDAVAWSDGEFLGAMRTYLPYEIGSGISLASTQVTALAPVTAPSALDGYQEQVSGGTYPEMTEDSLAEQMGDTGSLYQLLANSSQAPAGMVSWVVDPDLLESAAAIQDGYVVAAAGSSAADTPGPDANNAGSWLKEAKSVLGANGSELWQLPSTDPDIGSLSKAPASEARQLLSTAADQATTGDSIKNTVGVDPRGLVAWPADGQVSKQTLSLAQSIDPAAVVVDSDSIGLSTPNQSYTPTGRASAGGNSNLVVGDSALDAIMSGDPADAAYTSTGSNATILASQRLLAETALVALQEPNLGRSLLLALPRSASTAAADMTVLGALKSASWVKASTLSSLLKQSPDADASTGTPTRAASTVDTDLTSAQLAQSLALDSQLSLFQSILPSGGSVASGFAGAVLRTVSTSWRGATADWTAFSSTVGSRLQSQMNEVYLIPKSDLTLSGTSGAIPFTVVNKLPQTVELGLQIETKRTGLTVTQVPVRKFATGTTTVEVKVTASAPGAVVQVTAYLVNSAQRHYGSAESGGSQTLQVTVTSYGFVALLLFAGSAALLVFAVGLRIYRGRRGSRGGSETHAGD